MNRIVSSIKNIVESNRVFDIHCSTSNPLKEFLGRGEISKERRDIRDSLNVICGVRDLKVCINRLVGLSIGDLNDSRKLDIVWIGDIGRCMCKSWNGRVRNVVRVV